MDRNEKFIRKLSVRENQHVKDVIEQILSENFVDLDIKKRGFNDFYCVRIGRIRIIFSVGEQIVIR